MVYYLVCNFYSVLVIWLIWYIKHCKKFKFDSVVMINGAIGSGKTSTALWIALRSHKKAHKIWKFRSHFRKNLEEPLLYSNVPIMNYKYYVPLTNDLLLRFKRFNYKSVIFISESSLIANSMDFKNKKFPNLNDDLTEWLKLIRHELRGAYRSFFGFGSTIPNLIIETQSKNDNHYAFDRCITQSIYITSSYNIPFFRLCKCRELILTEGVTNEFNDDTKQDLISTYRYLVPKKIFKMYDSTCYSFLTDNLKRVDNARLVPKTKKKFRFHIPTFHPFIDIEENNNYLRDEKKEIEVIDNGQ